MVRQRWFLSWALISVLCLAPKPTSALIDDQGRALRLQNRAEAEFKADDLQEAEQLCRQVLEYSDRFQHRRACELLLQIYPRLGRPDLVIWIGTHYERLLRDRWDQAQRREVRLQIAESWFALGHWGECTTRLEQALADPGD